MFEEEFSFCTNDACIHRIHEAYPIIQFGMCWWYGHWTLIVFVFVKHEMNDQRFGFSGGSNIRLRFSVFS